jgi:hypothetical protein
MEHFSFLRFQHLAKSWWYENKFSFIMSLAGLAVLQTLAVWYWISLNFFASQQWLWSLLNISLLFVQAQRIYYSFKPIHNPKAAIQWLLLPATPHEKLLTAVFWNSFAFVLSGAILSIIIEKIGLSISENLYLENPVEYELHSGGATDWFFSKAYFSSNNGFMQKIWCFWLAAQFLFYWSAIRIKKGSSILAGIILMSGFYLYLFYLKAIQPIFFKKTATWDGGWTVSITENTDWKRIYQLGDPLATFLQTGLVVLCIYLLYKACTYLIREKTISH